MPTSLRKFTMSFASMVFVRVVFIVSAAAACGGGATAALVPAPPSSSFFLKRMEAAATHIVTNEQAISILKQGRSSREKRKEFSLAMRNVVPGYTKISNKEWDKVRVEGVLQTLLFAPDVVL